MTLVGPAKNNYQRDWVAKRRERGIELLGGKCVECGTTDKLEVDHIDPLTKVSHRIWSWSWKRIVEELAKCQLLCHDDHVAKTVANGDNQWWRRGVARAVS